METNQVVKKKNDFKTVVKRIWRKFLIFVKKQYRKFMSLPKHIRIISYIWVVVLILLVIVLCGSVKNKNFQDAHKEIEDRISRVAKRYAEDKGIYGSIENNEKIELDVLIDNSYMSRSEISDKTCEGFAVVFYNEDEEHVDTKAYINCKKYTTKGYKDIVGDKAKSKKK